MGGPRVMPDSVLLPNGVVIILNGAEEVRAMGREAVSSKELIGLKYMALPYTCARCLRVLLATHPPVAEVRPSTPTSTRRCTIPMPPWASVGRPFQGDDGLMFASLSATWSYLSFPCLIGYPWNFLVLITPYCPPPPNPPTPCPFRSQIPRLYHSTTALTTNGTILVSGCDRCGKVVTDKPFLQSPAKADYRCGCLHVLHLVLQHGHYSAVISPAAQCKYTFVPAVSGWRSSTHHFGTISRPSPGL